MKDYILEHHGVKGMKWGVRNEEESAGKEGGSKEQYKKAAAKKPKVSPEQRAKNLAEQEKLSKEKQGFKSEEPKRYLGLTGKQAAIGGTLAVGAVGAGLLAYGAYKVYGPKGDINPITFVKKVNESKGRVWGHGSTAKFTPDLFDLPELEFKAGHTFHRLSGARESATRHITYVTNNEEDFKRYVTAFGQEMSSRKAYHIQMRAKDTIKIPTMTETLDTFKEVIKDDWGHDYSNEAIQKIYSASSGGRWSDRQSRALIDALKGKGFSGMYDIMDVGILGESPLVLFAPENLYPKVVEPMTGRDTFNAMMSVNELAHRR